MVRESHPEKLDNKVFDAILRVRGNIIETYPEDAMIDSILRASYVGLQPEQQLQIVEKLGPDWMVEVAAKLEKKLAQIDAQGAD